MIAKSTKTLLALAIALAFLMVAGVAALFVLFIRLNVDRGDPDLQPPIQFTQTLSEFSPGNIVKMKEIAFWPFSDTNLDVVALFQPINGKHLFVIYGDGKFRSWDINEQNVVNEYDFISASTTGVNFSADGSWVITPGKVTPDGLNGYNIWDTDSGERVECWGAQCPNGDLDDLRFFDTGILLEPNKKLIVEYVRHTINAIGLQDGVDGALLSIDNPDDPNKPQIERMAMDYSGKYLAYALADGTVIVREADYFLSSKKGVVKSKEYEYADNNSVTTRIIDLKFDHTRRWLALLDKKELVVWDLLAYLNAEINMPIENGNMVVFDRNGKILVVGTDSGLSVINLITHQEIAKYDVGKVTALYFSRDNRLLVWCDENAGIHLWGVSGNK